MNPIPALNPKIRRHVIAQIVVAAKPRNALKFRRYWRAQPDENVVQHHAALLVDVQKHRLEVRQ